MDTISFDTIVERALERAEKAFSKGYRRRAETWYERAENLYHQHPTGNVALERRKYELYKSLFGEVVLVD